MLSLFIATFAHANPCLVVGPFRGTSDLRDYIHKTAAFDEGDHRDHRQTYEDYAKDHDLKLEDLKKTISASGKFQCGTGQGSAQLTIKSNVITTAAHMHYDPNTCRPYTPLSACAFTYEYEGVSHTLKIKSILASGFKCPKQHKATDDWMVLQLSEDAVGPKPYAININKSINVDRYTKFITVANQSVDFCQRDANNGQCLRDAKGKFIFPHHIQKCEVQNIYGTPDTNAYSTNCGMGPGASGGAALDENLDNPTLLGINVRGYDSPQVAKDFARTGSPVIRPYNESTWGSFHIPVDGDFYSALHALEGGG